MRFILVLATAALAAALPAERRHVQDTTSMTDMPMVRRDDAPATMAGMSMKPHHAASTTAPMPAGMTMMARDVAHGKKGNDEKKKTTAKGKMSMAAGKTMVVVADEPEATDMASMTMMARDVEHGKKGNDEKKKSVSTKAAVKATAAKTSAKMSMAAGKTMVVVADEPEATDMATMPMMARDVEHGKKGNDEKKKSVVTKPAAKATSAKMSMAAGKTMVVMTDEPESTEMSMPMMARDVEHGKKGNDEKKKTVSTKAAVKATPAKTSAKMTMAAGKTMVVVADEPESTEMSMPMMARDVEHGKKGNDEKKASSKMKMPAGKTMIVMPAATTFVKVRRDMTMAGMETMAMPASVHTVHHPAAAATTTAMAMPMA